MESDQAETKVRKFGDSLEESGRKGRKAGDDATAGLDKIASQLNKFSSAATGLGLALTGAFTAPVAAVTYLGVSMNNVEQSATIAFTKMLGSAKAAGSYLEELKNFAAKTPFEFPDLIKAAQRLMAVGFAANQVKPLLTAVGDAVAFFGGGADEINRVTLALSQMQGRGKVATQEMNQLTEALIPAWQILADKMHITQAELRDMVEKGLVPADQAISMITAGLNEKFGGAMDAASKRFKGLTSTIKDELGLISKELTEGLFLTMERAFAPLADALHNLRLALEDVSPGAKTAVFAIGLFAAAIGPALFVLGTMAGAVSNLINLYGQLAPLLPKVTAAIGTMTSGVTLAGAAITGVWVVAIGTAVLALGAIAVALYDAVKAERAMYQALKESREGADQAVAALKKHGIEIDTSKMSIDERTQALARAGQQLVKQAEAERQAAKDTAFHGAEVKNIRGVLQEMADQMDRQEEAAKKAKEAAKEARKEWEEWNKIKLDMVEDQTKSMLDLFYKFPAALDAITLSRQSLYNVQVQFQSQALEEIENQIALEKAMEGANKRLMEQPSQYAEITQALAGLNSKWADFRELLGQPVPTVDVGPIQKAKKTYLDNMREMKEATDDVKKSAGKIFDDMLIKGEGVFSSLNNLLKGGALSVGRSIFADVVGEFFGPAKKAFDDFFHELLQSSGLKSFIDGMAQKLAGALNGVIVGAAAFMAGFNITRGIQNTRQSPEASMFVRNFQDPFLNNQGTGAINKIVDAFAEAEKAGTLTVFQAKAAKDEVMSMWSAFRQEMDDFASQSDDNAKVVEQAMGTLGPIMQKILSDMDTSIFKLAETTGGAVDIFQYYKDAMELQKKASEEAAVLAKEQAEAAKEAAEAEKDRIEAEKAAAAALAELQRKAWDRVNQLNDSIADITDALKANHDQLVDALMSKWDLMNDHISDLSATIDQNKQRYADLNAEIAEMQKNLTDASYWTNRYNEIIGDTERAYQDATKNRESIARQVSTLEYEVKRESLQKIIQNSNSAAEVIAAKRELYALDKAQKAGAEPTKAQQLAEAKQQLQDAIELENKAKAAYESRKQTAESTIEAEKFWYQGQIAFLQAEAAERAVVIAKQEAYLQTLIAERTAFEKYMDSVGAYRFDEAQKIDATIMALNLRNEALQQEYNVLVQVRDAAMAAAMALAPAPSTTSGSQLEHMHVGGVVKKTGPYWLARGEEVVTERQAQSLKNSGGIEINVYVSGNDNPQHLGDTIGTRAARKLEQLQNREVQHGGGRRLASRGR